jgi:hypothetical protein
MSKNYCYLADDDLQVMEMIERVCLKHGVTRILTIDGCGGERDEFEVSTFLDDFKAGKTSEYFGMNFYRNKEYLGWFLIVFGNGDCTTIADSNVNQTEFEKEVDKEFNKLYDKWNE